MTFAFEEVTDIELALDPYPVPEQFGPLRHCEKEMRCASRGCGSSTFYKVQSVPRCMTHALRLLNELLVEKGVNN